MQEKSLLLCTQTNIKGKQPKFKTRRGRFSQVDSLPCHRHVALPHTGHEGGKSLQGQKQSDLLMQRIEKLTGLRCPNKVGKSLSCSLVGCWLLPDPLAQAEPEWDAARSQPGSDSMKCSPHPAKKFLPPSKDFYLPGANPHNHSETASSFLGFRQRN